MRKKFYAWLYRRFLPEWARRSLAEENERLRTRLLEAEAQAAKLEAYINGLEAGLRAQRRITINNNAAKEG